MSRPPTPRVAVVDSLHGVSVPDPYRWLERGDDPEVQQWVADQNRATRAALDAVPERRVWHERLLALTSAPVVLGAQVRGDVVIVLERPRGADQARLVRRSFRDPTHDPLVLVDPAGDADDGTVAIDWFWMSPDAELVAFGTSEGGTEDSELRIVRTSDGVVLSDLIPCTRACSLAWEPDGSGFFYTRYPEGDEYHRTVHHHTVGADWRDDPVVWAEHPIPEAWPNVRLSPDGRYLLVDAMVGWSRSDEHVLDRDTGTWHDVVVGVDAMNQLVFADDHTLVGVTTLGASNGRVVSIDVGAAADGPDAWVTVVPERDVVLGTPCVVPGGFVVPVTDSAVDRIEHWTIGGAGPTVVTGTGLVTVVGLATDRETGAVLAVLSGFDAPVAMSWAVFDSARGLALEPWVTDVDGGNAVDLPKFTVSQVEYPSIDGTLIGMFLIHRHDVTPSSDTPAVLTGYGGFAIAESPVWSPTIAAWCAAGGLYAIAGLRGGFEHGEDWHRAGRRGNKQNVFDDFHAAADWLVDTGCTSRDRLAIAGGSNGGLLVGAAITQRPDLCRAVWCAVPLLDMIRFPEFLIARLWTDEFGDPGVAEEFEWLMAYSPYHHVADGGRYPAVLFTTAEGDSRVDPMHARKMAALLQACAAGQSERPVLLSQEGRAGHGVGKPVSKQVAEQADVLAFFSWQLGAPA